MFQLFGASVKCVPVNYKNISEFEVEDEGIMGGKFPTLSWSEDAYINWLTQNSVNIGLGVASNLITIIGGLGMMATGARKYCRSWSSSFRWNGYS